MKSQVLSPAWLRRHHDLMAGHVERREVPGVVTLISRPGETHVDTIGRMAVGGVEPMRRDTIFRIASLTKPVAAAATMILVEEGRLRLDEPVDRLLPELADRRVLRQLDGPLHDTVPAHRPVMVRDLLTLRMGFGYIVGSGRYPIMEVAAERQLGMGPPKPSTPHDPDEWLRQFAGLPLMHQPGEQWMYEMGFAVLGVLIARAAGQPLEAFLRERLLVPLDMTDTGFSVPADKLHRLAPCYVDQTGTGELALYDGVDDSQWSQPPAFPAATGGLVSTVDDYLAFARMLLQGGISGDERILSRSSVQAMTTDQLTAKQKAASPSAPVFLGSSGWGLGVAVDRARGGESAAAARYGWGGGLGTSWYTYPNDGLIALLMTQRLPPPSAVFDDFWSSVDRATVASPTERPA
jgi:CubicO group peptidase (beta-lactamase class C family)